MRKGIVVLLAGSTFCCACLASLAEWQEFSGRYTIFSGDQVAGREAPTPTDRKLAIAVKGQVAKDLFDSIGPDVEPTCSGEDGDRSRRKQGVQCTYHAKGAAQGYRCWIGIDLRTGRSAAVVSC